MTDHVVLSVYAVDDKGVTGNFLGGALTVEPFVALAYPALVEALRSWTGPLRVAGAPDPARPFAHVYDVAQSQALDGAPDLVLLLLTRSDVGPAAPLILPETPATAPLADEPLVEDEAFLVDPFDPAAVRMPPPRPLAQIITELREVLAAAPPPPQEPGSSVGGFWDSLVRLFNPGHH